MQNPSQAGADIKKSRIQIEDGQAFLPVRLSLLFLG
jgi:hypothetical protein